MQFGITTAVVFGYHSKEMVLKKTLKYLQRCVKKAWELSTSIAHKMVLVVWCMLMKLDFYRTYAWAKNRD